MDELEVDRSVDRNDDGEFKTVDDSFELKAVRVELSELSKGASLFGQKACEPKEPPGPLLSWPMPEACWNMDVEFA